MLPAFSFVQPQRTPKVRRVIYLNHSLERIPHTNTLYRNRALNVVNWL
jgi:hypothetical protein